MPAAELTSETIAESHIPAFSLESRKFFYVKGTSAANSDFLTLSKLTTVEGGFLIGSDGTVITMTFSTNKITLTNSGTLTVSGLAWGV